MTHGITMLRQLSQAGQEGVPLSALGGKRGSHHRTTVRRLVDDGLVECLEVPSRRRKVGGWGRYRITDKGRSLLEVKPDYRPGDEVEVWAK